MDNNVQQKENEQKKQNKQNKQKMPTSLFELLIFLIKNFIKTLPQRLIFALITGVVVLIAHTYLMVVLNEGFSIDYNTKLLKYILMTNGSSSVNVTLFWMLISALFWGTIAQIRGVGIKVFFFKQIDNFAKLMSDIFEKFGSVQLSMFLGSICTGIVIGIILSNPAMSILLSIFIFMAVSARGTSLLILIIYLTWSDLQRLFRIKPRKAFYIDIVSMILRGISIGLLLFAFTPYVKYGNVVQYIVLLAFLGLLILNIIKKTKPNIASFLLLLGGAFLITSTKVFADDGGWTEGGGTFGSWAKTEGAWEAIKRAFKPMLGAISIGLGFVPVLGDLKDAQEAFTGIDLVTGEKLSVKDRLITGVAMIVPVVNGKVLRKGIGIVADGVKNIARHGDEATDIIRHGDDILDSTRAGEKAIDGYESAEKIAKNTDNITDATTGVSEVNKGTPKTIISPEMENKILYGERSDGNKLKGGHSPQINNANPNYAVEVKSENADGTKIVKFTTQFSDGNLANIKTSTLFPENWRNQNIIDSIKTVGDTPTIGVRDNLTLHRGSVNGVEIDVIKEGNKVISGYPTGGKLTPGFNPVK